MVFKNISGGSKTVIDEDGNEYEVEFKGENGKWYAGAWPQAMIENPNPEGHLWVGYGEQSNMPSRTREVPITIDGLSSHALLTGISSLGRHDLTVSLGIQQVPKAYTSWFIGADIDNVLERVPSDRSNWITESKILDPDEIQRKARSNADRETVFTGTAQYIEGIHAVDKLIKSRNENEENDQIVIILQDFPAEALTDANLDYTGLLSRAQRSNIAIILSLSGVHHLPEITLEELSSTTNIISFKTVESVDIIRECMDGFDPVELGEFEAFSRLYLSGQVENGIRISTFREYPSRKDAVRLAYI